ncbi:MAG: type VI secretion system amidase effector protein Tae4 [Neisseria zoodegmatis]|uniref:type VI secretion system amidase effector protein Tae4 n=1 Tax=Neisseria zoodegmatis TaxID=326523 RepID=UPI0026EBEA7B|nr:type VI secretion system amidase effector protein Tae4 [Neisseria zoodegmatis]MDO5070456.1 type VI secretion system amidase effector protein Tae4 [Neisseria zoodegmatis]
MSISASAQGQTSSVTVKRPKFSDLWSAYPINSTAEQAYRLVGGSPLAHYEENPRGYANACAIRLSRSFNHGNFPLTRQRLSKVPRYYALSGGDGKPYLLRVNDIIKYVQNNLGKPDIELVADGTNQSRRFAGRKGIIIFIISGWGDATGHVTLWNDYECGDKCYFQPDNAKLIKILFWDLKD